MTARAMMVQGRTGFKVNVETRAYTDTRVDPTVANTLIRFATDGDMTVVLGNGPAPSDDEWWEGVPQAGIGNQYSIRANTTSGSLNHGSSEAAGVWLALSSPRDFGTTRTGFGSHPWLGTFSFSRDGGSTIEFTSPGVSTTSIVDL